MILCFIRSGTMKGAHIKHNEKNCHILKLTGRGGEKKKKGMQIDNLVFRALQCYTHTDTHTQLSLFVRPHLSFGGL